jgi:predicted peroxiredoxin
MKHLKLFIVLLLVFSVAMNAQSKSKKSTAKKVVTEEVVPPPPPPPDGMFIHISSGQENPQKVLMALTMALKMADDHDVYVYMDINAINVVLNSAKSIEMPKFEPSKILIGKLISKGVKVAACQLCLEAANKTQFDLMKGITLANKDDFFSFTRGRILSLSY